MKLKHLILITLLLLCFTPNTWGQNNNDATANQINLLLTIADSSSDTTVAYQMANQALKLAQGSNQLEGQIKAYSALGKLDLKSSNFGTAIKNASRAHELSVNSNFEIGNLGIIHHLMSSGLEGIGAYRDAITHRKNAISWQLENNPEYTKDNSLYFALSKIGLLFMNLEEYDSAKTYFNKALMFSSTVKDPGLLGGMYNNIGFVHFKLNEIDSAKFKFKRALESFELLKELEQKDSFMIALIKGNLANCLDDFSPLKAIYYKEDIEGSIAYGDYVNAVSSSIDYANFLIRKRNYMEAEKVLMEAISLSKNKSVSYSQSNRALYQSLTYLSIESGQIEKAKMYFEHLIELLKKEKSPSSIEDLIQAHSTYKLSKIESDLKIEQIESEKKIAEISYLNKENELTNLKYVASIVIAIFIAVILILIILRIRSNANRRAREEDLKNRLLKLELDYNSERLNRSVLSLSRKKEFAEELLQRIRTIKEVDQKSFNDMRFYILNELEIDESIIDKEKEVKEVGADIIIQLKNQFPGLSETDVKLLSFIKMKLTNKQIAEIKNITQNSVKIAKNRLRKKLNIPPGADIFEHLSF